MTRLPETWEKVAERLLCTHFASKTGKILTGQLNKKFLFNRRQYLLMLKRRAQEVRDDIDADRKFLEKLAKDEEEMAKDKSERMNMLKMELDLARKAFAKQAEVEKLKMKQCEFMFEEEARRMLEKQNMRWKLEEEARNKLMNEILQMRKVQEKEKLLQNLKEQEEMRRWKEVMMKKIEEVQRELNEYNSRAKESSDIWRKQLDHMALEKRLLLIQQKKKLEEEREMALSAMRKEEEMLLRELSKMNLNRYQPKNYPRRTFQPL